MFFAFRQHAVDNCNKLGPLLAVQDAQSQIKKKQSSWCLIITLANVDWFSKFFLHVIYKEIIYVYTTKISTSPKYVACKIRKCKKNVTKFSRWTW